MHDAGIVYRATRLVNWSCALKSAISDIEVYICCGGGGLSCNAGGLNCSNNNTLSIVPGISYSV